MDWNSSFDFDGYGNGGVNDFSFFTDFIDECLINFIFWVFVDFIDEVVVEEDEEMREEDEDKKKKKSSVGGSLYE